MPVSSTVWCMHEHGDLPIFLSIGAEQIVVSALLWPVDEQKDKAAFNEFLLKAQKLVPLSNFGITTVAGRDYYEIFGELTCKTTLQTVIIELRMRTRPVTFVAIIVSQSARLAS